MIMSSGPGQFSSSLSLELLFMDTCQADTEPFQDRQAHI